MSEEGAHILIIDDDRRIRALLASYLADRGYRTTAVGSAKEAREQMRGLRHDLLILDVMMPGEDGVAFAAGLRKAAEDVPILMLSALTEASDRIKGLAAGSDDYLGKPFEPEELLLRVQSLLRRMGPLPAAGEEVRFGGFVFAPASGELTKDDVRVHLTSRERELLRLLAQANGKPVPRTALAAPGAEDQARAVDVQINRLRQKIEDDPANPIHLQTVRGEGYALIAAPVRG